MATWNALYFRGDVPAGYRPEVEGTCGVRRLAGWTELALPGVADGEPSARSLSKCMQGPVIWAIVQTTASVVGIAHFQEGECRRRIEFADGSWRHVEGEPEPWEARLFSREELDAAKEIGDPDDDAELEAGFASRTLEVGKSLPWPREWETLCYALDVTRPELDAVAKSPCITSIEGRRTSKLTHVARLSLLAAVGCAIALGWTRNPDFAGLGVVLGLIAWGAGFLRRMNVGRWFF